MTDTAKVERLAAFKVAIRIIGTQLRVAEIVGCTQPNIARVLKLAIDVPAEWCPKLERATAEKGETIFKHQLRPDLWDPVEQAAE